MLKSQDNKCLVIIPAFNEEENISKVISGIRRLSYAVDILVLDDGSLDATARVAKESGAIVVSLPLNMGYGVALQTGFKYAARNNYSYVIHMDADGQHDPQSIASLLSELGAGNADIVVGSRFLGDSGYQPDIPRKIGIALFRAIASTVMRQKITDPTSGFQALNLKAVRFYCKDTYPSDFPDADMLILSHLAGLRIKEVPVIMHKSPLGKRKMHSGFTSVYYVFKMLLSILVTLLRERPEKEA